MTEDTADGRSRPGTEGNQPAGQRPRRQTWHDKAVNSVVVDEA